MLSGMDSQQLGSMMEQCGIRPTPTRILILRTLANTESLITALDIEETLQTVDRSSISRAMPLFVNAGLVHAVDDGTGAVKYEMCHDLGGGEDTDCHPHFHCIKCQNTVCLDAIAVPAIDIPEGCILTGINYVVHGICADCVKKN